LVTDVVTKVPATGGGTQDQIDQVTTTKVYPFTFEHHSPNDTWGYYCNSYGRVNYKNPYQRKRCNRNQIRLTGALNSANDGAVNYLHYFSNEDEFLIEEQGWGGIQSMLVRDDGKIILICEQTVFSLAYNDDRAVVQDGYIVVPTNNKFSRPDRDASFNYGCQSKDLNTIERKGSLVMFLDTQRSALVNHNFQTAVDISDGIQSWLVPSIKEVQANDAMYWHSVIDHKANRYLLTKFNLNNRVYTNKKEEVDYKANETIYFDISGKMWGRMLHYTPEYYASLFGEGNIESQLFSFKGALPYAQYKRAPKAPYLNYFGEQCSPVIGVVSNGNGQANTVDAVKYFLFTEVYCREIQFIIRKITTESKQESSLLEGPWETGEGYWFAAYLCDILNQDACVGRPGADLLFDGDPLFGKWLKAIYTARDDYKGEFFRLQSINSEMDTR
jgi:hypothetical protein